MNEHEKDCMFQTLELLRKTAAQLFRLQSGQTPDYKDVDDWVFSELPFTKSDITELYKDKNILVYDGSAISET